MRQDEVSGSSGLFDKHRERRMEKVKGGAVEALSVRLPSSSGFREVRRIRLRRRHALWFALAGSPRAGRRPSTGAI
jgi:hypothetical protein